jgi:hypothetical protein
MSEATEVAISPLVEAAGMAWNVLVGWMFIPVEGYHALKVSAYYPSLDLKQVIQTIFLLSLIMY